MYIYTDFGYSNLNKTLNHTSVPLLECSYWYRQYNKETGELVLMDILSVDGYSNISPILIFFRKDIHSILPCLLLGALFQFFHLVILFFYSFSTWKGVKILLFDGFSTLFFRNMFLSDSPFCMPFNKNVLSSAAFPVLLLKG